MHRRGTPRSSCSEERRTACRCRTEVARLGLTGAQFDLDNPVHLNPLQRAYERLPEIGGRAASCGSARLAVAVLRAPPAGSPGTRRSRG
ncbi:DUF5953 family protein [Cystobacter fuscus]|uniref:DUF5953 family protein n=1 Tax=Cystobacter fuscus TaxID=43 RepID=UPI0022B7645F|nr:DUF5953 family protein [Cystobacter fuscus]